MTLFEGGPCEADLCQSDFDGYYELLEPMMGVMTTGFAPGQVEGFAVPTFDGAHFDIDEPQEESDGFSLNRVGETGYNNPLLNIYLAR